jgi:hypothetical protein
MIRSDFVGPQHNALALPIAVIVFVGCDGQSGRMQQQQQHAAEAEQ